MKDTAQSILGNKEFVIHIVDEQSVEKINYTGASLPPNLSEIEKANISITESEIVSVPGIEEANVNHLNIMIKSVIKGRKQDVR